MLRLRIAAAAALVVAGACASAGSREEGRAVPSPSLERVADNVWIHKSYADLPGVGPFLSQGMVVATPAGALMVDTAWTDEDTGKVIALAAEATGAAPIAGVATHAHNDKMGGMAAANARMTTAALDMTNWDARLRNLVPALHSIPAAAMSDPLVLRRKAADGSVLVGEVELFYPGPGHTRDNIVVYYAPARVLFGGCLIRPADAKSLGNTADGDIAHWANAVRAVAERFPQAEIVIPSHGERGGRELLDHTIALAEAARAAN